MSSMPSLSYAAFSRFGAYQRHAAGCVCCFTCGGPAMIILGIISIVSAAANLRGHRINNYGAAINAWQSSGSASLQAAYASTAPAVVVTFPVAPLVNRLTVTTANFSLAAQTSVTPLLDRQTNDYPTTYNNALWFQGSSAQWPTAYDSSALNVIRVTTGALSVTVPAWTCSDVASPPGCFVQTSTGRRLLTTKAPPCTSYARVLSSVSNVGLLVVVANASSAALSLDTCSTTYATVTSIPSAWQHRRRGVGHVAPPHPTACFWRDTPTCRYLALTLPPRLAVTASQYQLDNTVCAGLSATVVSAVTGAPPTVTLRSSLDPYGTPAPLSRGMRTAALP